MLRNSLGHTNGSLVGDNYFYSVKTGALGAKRSAIVRSGLGPWTPFEPDIVNDSGHISELMLRCAGESTDPESACAAQKFLLNERARH